MSLKTLSLALGAGATLLVGSAIAGSHSDVPAAVAARQAHMQLYAFNLGQLGGMARGNVEYDADVASTAATALANVAGLSQALYYPEGTSSDEIESSKALPAIWTEMERYNELNADLQDAAANLASVAGDGQEALGGGLRTVGQACGACHKQFQMEDE